MKNNNVKLDKINQIFYIIHRKALENTKIYRKPLPFYRLRSETSQSSFPEHYKMKQPLRNC